jgi:hypothetical protein
LREIGRYYVGYRRLMQHWNAVIPGGMHHVSYEDLVANQRSETRKLLEYCGLEWEERCVAFHENPAPSTTASATQVRRPVYDSSLSRWRHYEEQLADLKDEITSAGYGV